MPSKALLFILSNFRERGILNYTICFSSESEGVSLNNEKNIVYIPPVYHGHDMFEVERILSLILGVKTKRSHIGYSSPPRRLKRNKPSNLSKELKINSVSTRRSEEYDCEFCIKIKNQEGILWEDSELVAFFDKHPASSIHILIVPKRHINDISCLGKSDVHLVEKMGWLGAYILNRLIIPVSPIYKEYPPNSTRTDIVPLQSVTKDYQLGFHTPPFTSKKHLHLHVMTLPVLVNERKYMTLRDESHWVDLNDLIDDLEE